MENQGEINALIQLLDDSDVEVYKHVYAKLKSYGPEVVPLLEQAWGAELNPAAHERLEEIIHEIQFDSLIEEWRQWTALEKPDLLTGAFLVAKYHYPDIRLEDVQKRIAKLKQAIWLELNYHQTPLEQVQVFNQVFYQQQAFKGAQTSSDFQDFCINNVLESKKGNSVVVGIIYQVLAHELTLPVYGVTLIRHYVLAYCKKLIFDFNTDENLEREVMFYINPINKGSVFSRNEIKDYLDKLKEEQRAQYFTPCSNQAIINELLQYLIEIYSKQNRADRLRDLNLMIELL